MRKGGFFPFPLNNQPTMESVGLAVLPLVFASFFGLAYVILMYASIWKVFVKAGKPGWAAIIPIYNTIVLLEIVGKPVWWILLMLFVPFGGLIWGIWAINLLSLSFGKDTGFTLGLLLLGFIFFPILGFGSAQYIGPAGNNFEGGPRTGNQEGILDA